MLKKLRLWLLAKLALPPEPMRVSPLAKTIPEAFGYPEPKFEKLVGELFAFITPSDRVVSLDLYLRQQLYSNHGLNMNDPKDAAVFGYAFCSAVFIQREIMQNEAAKNALQAIYGEPEDPLTIKQKVVN